MTKTLIWRATKTRVLPSRVLDNPWSRTGTIARDHKAFVAGLSADRPEEDEDYPVMVPPRATRSWCPREGVFFEVDQALYEALVAKAVQRLTEDDVEGDPVLLSAHERARARHQAAVYTVDLEANYEVLEQWERRILRVENGHWFQAYDGPLDYRVKNPKVVQLLCSDGQVRPITPQRVAWVLEHGEISTQLRLTRCCQTGCLAPAHHRSVRRRDQP